MDRWRSDSGSILSSAIVALRPHLVLAVATAFAALPLIALSTLVPPHMVLPIVSLVALSAACVVATLAWRLRARRAGERVTLWDVAGAAAFVGIAAGALSEPTHVLELFGHAMPD